MSERAITPVTYHDDGKFVRTAIVLTPGDDGRTGSIDIVNEIGERIALINLFTNEDNTWFAVDVIDKDENFDTRRAIVFEEGVRHVLDAGTIVATDFRKKEAE